MKLLTLASLFFGSLCLGTHCYAQCSAPEVLKGATKYDAEVCKGITASGKGEYQRALEFFLSASKEFIDESPNILVFGRIADTYAHLGKFKEADRYLRYDDLSLLWAIGVVRCRPQPNSNNESLLQDGELLKSAEAKYMVDVLCGPIFDNDDYFADRDTASFVPAAKAILRYDALRKQIDLMRAKQHSN
jgi:hypothetical protein